MTGSQVDPSSMLTVSGWCFFPIPLLLWVLRFTLGEAWSFSLLISMDALRQWFSGVVPPVTRSHNDKKEKGCFFGEGHLFICGHSVITTQHAKRSQVDNPWQVGLAADHKSLSQVDMGVEGRQVLSYSYENLVPGRLYSSNPPVVHEPLVRSHCFRRK